MVQLAQAEALARAAVVVALVRAPTLSVAEVYSTLVALAVVAVLVDVLVMVVYRGLAVVLLLGSSSSVMVDALLLPYPTFSTMRLQLATAVMPETVATVDLADLADLVEMQVVLVDRMRGAVKTAVSVATAAMVVTAVALAVAPVETVTRYTQLA